MVTKKQLWHHGDHAHFFYIYILCFFPGVVTTQAVFLFLRSSAESEETRSIYLVFLTF